MHNMQSQKLRLLKKKLILAKALKGLRKLITLSNLKDDDQIRSFNSNEVYSDHYNYDDYDEVKLSKFSQKKCNNFFKQRG